MRFGGNEFILYLCRINRKPRLGSPPSRDFFYDHTQDKYTFQFYYKT